MNILQLPAEMLIKILARSDASTLMSFCRAFNDKPIVLNNILTLSRVRDAMIKQEMLASHIPQLSFEYQCLRSDYGFNLGTFEDNIKEKEKELKQQESIIKIFK